VLTLAAETSVSHISAGAVAVNVTEEMADASPARPRRGHWLAVIIVIIVALLAAAYMAAVSYSHAALSGGFTGWSGVVPGHSAGLGSVTSADRALIGPTPGYSQVLWASRPGGEVTAGFQVHNGGPIAGTLLGLAPRSLYPGSTRLPQLGRSHQDRPGRSPPCGCACGSRSFMG
jgi:hypothetical protein